MNYSTILFITFFHLYLNQRYQLKSYCFYFISIDFDLTLNNQNNFKDGIYYSGRSEAIDDSIPFKKEGAHELVFLLNGNDSEIEKFPKTTIFIIPENRARSLENKYKDYRIFIANLKQFLFKIDFRESQYCLIGNLPDEAILRVLIIFVDSSIIICLIIFFLNIIMTKIINVGNTLKIHTYINGFCIFLSALIFFVGIDVIILEFNHFLFNFYELSCFAILKGFYYSTMYFCLRGDMILSFNENDNVRFFNKKRVKITSVSFYLVVFFKLFTYYFSFVTELTLLYIKNILEHLVLLYFTIYSIKEKLIPLYNQMKYEQRIHSKLVKCIEFKYERMLFFDILMIIYNLFFILSTPIEHKYIFSYINNNNIHFIMQLFYEAVFFIFFFFIFFPMKLPRYYYDKVILNNEKANLRVNIYQKRNLSDLTSNILKEITNYPIILVNPFISSKNKFSSNEMNIGFIQKENE